MAIAMIEQKHRREAQKDRMLRIQRWSPAGRNRNSRGQRASSRCSVISEYYETSIEWLKLSKDQWKGSLHESRPDVLCSINKANEPVISVMVWRAWGFGTCSNTKLLGK
jgi:hypothetical protein